MEFLVHIHIDLPSSMSESERRRLETAEAGYAAELRTSGRLVRIWRDPGKRANWSLYDMPDVTSLHTVLSGLPLWPWMNINVHPLALHPAETNVEAKAN